MPAIAPTASRLPARPMAIVVQAMPRSMGACGEESARGLACFPWEGRAGYPRAAPMPACLWRDPALASAGRAVVCSAAAAAASVAFAGRRASLCSTAAAAAVAASVALAGRVSAGRAEAAGATNAAAASAMVAVHGGAPCVWWTVPWGDHHVPAGRLQFAYGSATRWLSPGAGADPRRPPCLSPRGCDALGIPRSCHATRVTSRGSHGVRDPRSP
jgi:hypothetical protein